MLPRYLIPKYFYLAVMAVYKQAIVHTLRNMSKFVQDGDEFIHCLALGYVFCLLVC